MSAGTGGVAVTHVSRHWDGNRHTCHPFQTSVPGTSSGRRASRPLNWAIVPVYIEVIGYKAGLKRWKLAAPVQSRGFGRSAGAR